MGGGCGGVKTEKPSKYKKGMFNFEKIIGKGGFGRVWRVKDKKSSTVYALKVIGKARVMAKRSVSSIMNEKEILSSFLSQPSNFIVNMHCAFQDRENLYLLLDYMDAGDLRYYINKRVDFNELQIKFLIRCLLQGLSYIHSKNIIHRDIKPQNIIIDSSGYVRLTDMGIARYWRTENSQQTSGTPGYMAPQVLLKQNHSFVVDYYAVGVVAYELLMQKRPYNGQDRKSIRDQMLSKQISIPLSYMNKMSLDGMDFINRVLIGKMQLLQRVPRKRLGHNGISQIFEHPWLSQSFPQNFVYKQMKSPIIPLEIVYSRNLQQQTQMNEIQTENMLLLKRSDIQKLFQGYNYQKNGVLQNNISLETIPNSIQFGQRIFY